MARYEVFSGSVEGSYLLDVQTDLIDRMTTRMVVPLLPVEAAPPPVKKLHPVFEIGGHRLVMATHLMAAVPTAELKESRFSLSKHHDDIVAALDMLFQGF